MNSPVQTRGKIDFEYEFLGGHLAEKFVELYEGQLRKDGLENTVLSGIRIDNDGLLTNTNPLQIIYGLDILFDDIGRRCPSLTHAMAITHMDAASVNHGNASFFDGVVADVGLLVQDYAHERTRNADITLDLRSQLGNILSEDLYDRGRGGNFPTPVDKNPNAHYIVSFNNLQVVPRTDAKYGISLRFRNPDTVPRTDALSNIGSYVGNRSFSLFKPSGEYKLPTEFLTDNSGGHSAILPADFGTMRVYIKGPEGVTIGGPNLIKATNESRLLVVKGNRFN